MHLCSLSMKLLCAFNCSFKSITNTSGGTDIFCRRQLSNSVGKERKWLSSFIYFNIYIYIYVYMYTCIHIYVWHCNCILYSNSEEVLNLLWPKYRYSRQIFGSISQHHNITILATDTNCIDNIPPPTKVESGVTDTLENCWPPHCKDHSLLFNDTQA